MELLVIAGSVLTVSVILSIASKIAISIASSIGVIVIKRVYVKARKKIRLIKHNYKQRKMLKKEFKKGKEKTLLINNNEQIEIE